MHLTVSSSSATALLLCFLICASKVFGQALPPTEAESTKPRKADQTTTESSIDEGALFDDDAADDEEKKLSTDKPAGSPSLDKIADSIFTELGKQSLGIDKLSSLKRSSACTVEHRQHRFRCTATADSASISVDSLNGVKLDLTVKVLLRGKIRRGRVVKVRMEDATVDVKKMPDEISMWRPRGLRRIQRELKRRYIRLAIATRRISRRMLPKEVKL